MQNKLQELTDKLYNEGLSKGKKEAEDLKAAAVKESDRIIADARKEAGRIIADARKEAEELRTRVENDIRMASSQTISAVRQQVESIIISKAISTGIKDSLEDPELVKSLMQERLREYFKKNAADAMDKGIDVTFSKQIQGGFKIGPKDGGYMISFAEGDFENILTEYLRPTARKLLFGQE